MLQSVFRVGREAVLGFRRVEVVGHLVVDSEHELAQVVLLVFREVVVDLAHACDVHESLPLFFVACH